MSLEFQKSGSFQLIYDLTHECATISDFASRKVYLNGNYELKLEGAQLNCSPDSSISLVNSPSLLIRSPQIISTMTPSNPGFILTHLDYNVLPDHIAAGATVLNYQLNCSVGNVLSHVVLASFQNRFDIQVGVSNIAGFNNTLGYVPFDRNWTTLYTNGTPALLTLTFSYLKLDRLI